MKRIIFTRPDGGVTVVTPVINTHTVVDGVVVPVPENISEDEAVTRALARIPADAVNVQVVDESVIPSDRSARRAWRQSGASIVVDAAAQAALKDQDAAFAIDGIDRLQFEHLFDLENRTRAIEGQPQITRAQYRNALINRWKALN
jgi:putative heme iron utilization protein